MQPVGQRREQEANMKSIRIMNRPEDFKALGINPERVEPWEDGRRCDDRPGAVEWWYFDAETDDGITVNVNFATNPPTMRPDEKGYHPFVYYNVQFADGTCETDINQTTADECRFGEGLCDIRIGSSYARGNLDHYELHLENAEGTVKIDLKFDSRAASFRPGTAYFERENGDYFTWLCVVPRADVTGTIECSGKTMEIHGRGYHDHQWGTAENHEFWNRWVWGRQQIAGHTVLIFDFVSTRDTGAVEFPVFAVIGPDGNVIIRNEEYTENVSIEVFGTRPSKGGGKLFPDRMRYTFTDGDTTAVFELDSEEEYTSNNHYDLLDDDGKAAYDARGIYPSISRYYAAGHLILKRDGETVLDESGKMHYEVESLYSNYILDASDKEAALATDPVEESRAIHARTAAAANEAAEAGIDASGAPDPDLAGIYDAIIDTPMGRQRGELCFNVSGTELSGTMDFMKRTYKIENGVATEEGFAYEINAKVMMRKMHATVSGKRTGDSVEGKLTTPMGSIRFEGAKRNHDTK